MSNLLKIAIVYQDNYILVINKPAGLVVNRCQTTRETTLQDWIENNIKYEKLKIKSKEDKDTEEFNLRSGIVHRLDKETSGLMVIAKTASSFAKLQDQFKQRKVEKKYLLLTHGAVVPLKGNIRLPIARNPKNRMRFTIKLGGKMAETDYQVIKNIIKDNQAYSLIEATPKTGRTHQLRVHFQHIGHPIVSDSLYLSRKRLRSDKKWCPRLFLHASYLGFFHPKTGKWKEFEAQTPDEISTSNY